MSVQGHALYRFYAADDALLYIGITGNLGQRLAQHEADKPWWTEVVRVAVEQYPDRLTVLEAEASAIRRERPRHNRTHIARRHRPERIDVVRPQTITIQEAADAMCVCARTIRRHIAAGRLTAYRFGPTLIRVDPAELQTLLRPIPSASA